MQLPRDLCEQIENFTDEKTSTTGLYADPPPINGPVTLLTVLERYEAEHMYTILAMDRVMNLCWDPTHADAADFMFLFEKPTNPVLSIDVPQLAHLFTTLLIDPSQDNQAAAQQIREHPLYSTMIAGWKTMYDFREYVSTELHVERSISFNKMGQSLKQLEAFLCAPLVCNNMSINHVGVDPLAPSPQAQLLYFLRAGYFIPRNLFNFMPSTREGDEAPNGHDEDYHLIQLPVTQTEVFTNLIKMEIGRRTRLRNALSQYSKFALTSPFNREVYTHVFSAFVLPNIEDTKIPMQSLIRKFASASVLVTSEAFKNNTQQQAWLNYTKNSAQELMNNFSPTLYANGLHRFYSYTKGGITTSGLLQALTLALVFEQQDAESTDKQNKLLNSIKKIGETNFAGFVPPQKPKKVEEGEACTQENWLLIPSPYQPNSSGNTIVSLLTNYPGLSSTMLSELFGSTPYSTTHCMEEKFKANPAFSLLPEYILTLKLNSVRQYTIPILIRNTGEASMELCFPTTAKTTNAMLTLYGLTTNDPLNKLPSPLDVMTSLLQPTSRKLLQHIFQDKPASPANLQVYDMYMDARISLTCLGSRVASIYDLQTTEQENKAKWAPDNMFLALEFAPTSNTTMFYNLMLNL